MSASVSAPAQPKQPSRKGKKAWRKNVDVTEIHEGLQEVRAQIIQGGVIAEKTADQLFVVDTFGDKEVARKVTSRHKPLKADEILAQRSAIPAVSSRKRLSDFEEPKPKKSRVSGKDYDKLRAIAYGGDQVQKDIVEIGTADHDPWAVQDVKKDPKYSFLEEKKAKREPATLKRAPVSLAKDGKEIPALRKPEAGKSYNPLLEDWANLIEREGQKEVEAEKVRLQEAREEAEHMERVIAAAEEPDTEDDNESAWESEWEGFSDVDDDSKKQKRPERKTPTQRNKIKRRKEAERLARHEAKMRARDKQALKIQDLIKSVAEKEKATAAAREVALTLKGDEASSDGEEVLRKKRFGKNPIPEPTLEVVLADELQDSLRRLKPEGNLLKDRFRSMIVRGKVESRRQIAYHKKPKTTLTEKWSYKDWTLD
ncbi:putative 60S ribosomal biogenesis protein Nop53 [Amniculicola lignicola CBS 123094]|uniref:Ribosome biogenesis protein NOP53 n=1 Tax=Amniculicola lignicola CBS 123094 TaxID=1392246 RepID=A0A6A5VT78_9PLEO|nr:putative 60S ribosomal biogenesis protein Nop53 [Amniculicola lignicola CBS 123094]